jgi:hypothetical protein
LPPEIFFLQFCEVENLRIFPVNFIEIKLEKQICTKLYPKKVAKKQNAGPNSRPFVHLPMDDHHVGCIRNSCKKYKKHCGKQDQKPSREVKQILMLQDLRIPL